MNKRPVTVTVIASLLILAGIFGSAVHIKELVSSKAVHFEDLWIPVFGFLPAMFGVFILLGRNWARWLAVAWMTFHVAISFFDSWQKVVVHFLLLGLIAYALFGREAKTYFRQPHGAKT